ncbi:ankyrin repeat domain-containing protein 29-like isoform X2 [Haliotis asinina]|uniref:ankyrin repeat domain-containing protein 29-like isoform X2 n=1 Tax=Haliotis asinina TaxID=109174 RepID=UPI003531A7E0
MTVPNVERATETPTKDPPEGTQSYKPYTTAPVIVVNVTVAVILTVILVVVEVARRLWKCRRTRYRRRLDYADKCTDLYKASCCGDVSRVNSILSEGQVDINCVDVYGRTPVMWAARQKQNEVFDVLVSNGASLSLTDKSGNNILHSACHGGHKDIVQNILLEESVDINSKDRDGSTAVMIAERKGYKDVVDLLVRNGADLPVHDEMETQFSTEPLL